MNTQIRPPCDQMAGAVNIWVPPGVGISWICPPRRPLAPPVVPLSRSRSTQPLTPATLPQLSYCQNVQP